MRRRWLIGAGVAAVLVAAGVFWLLRGATPEAGVVIDANDPKLVALGRSVYGEHCAACHGERLKGEPNWRVRKANGRMPAPPHDADGHTWHHTDGVLFKLTKYGPAALVGRDYESDMPAYNDILSDQEILAVLAYIKSTWPEEIRARHDAMNAAQARQRN